MESGQIQIQSGGTQGMSRTEVTPNTEPAVCTGHAKVEHKQTNENLALIFAVLAAVLYSANGELLQAFQSCGASVHISPLLNLVVCHSGGLVFAPHLLRPPPSDISRLYMFTTSLFFAVMLTGYNYAWIQSSKYIALGLTNSIYQSSVMFVYIASVVLFREPLSLGRFLGVVLCMLGVTAASGVDHFQEQSNGAGFILGLWLAFAAAMGITMYQIIFQVLFGNRKCDSHFLEYFYACVGLEHVVIILPLTLIASDLGFESSEFPSTVPGIAAVLLSGALASIVNFLVLCVIAWGKPMLPTCANVLSIPFMIVLDMTIHGIMPDSIALVGQALVMSSIVLILGVNIQEIVVTLFQRIRSSLIDFSWQCKLLHWKDGERTGSGILPLRDHLLQV